jgi:hypothetical protein
MSPGVVVLQLQLCLWSFNTSIASNVPPGFPANIIVQQELRSAVAQLWRGSATFREQCLKIGRHPRYRVAITTVPELSLSRTMRARCVLSAYSSGYVSARVMVPVTRQVLELIPHELEHVVEHVEGVDVRRASRFGAGAYDAGQGQIETMRAVRAGRQVRDEVGGAAATPVALASRR